MRYVSTFVIIALLGLVGAACSRQEAKKPNKDELLAQAETNLTQKAARPRREEFPRGPAAVSGRSWPPQRRSLFFTPSKDSGPLAVPFLKQAAELKPDDAENTDQARSRVSC